MTDVWHELHSLDSISGTLESASMQLSGEYQLLLPVHSGNTRRSILAENVQPHSAVVFLMVPANGWLRISFSMIHFFL